MYLRQRLLDEWGGLRLVVAREVAEQRPARVRLPPVAPDAVDLQQRVVYARRGITRGELRLVLEEGHVEVPPLRREGLDLSEERVVGLGQRLVLERGEDFVIDDRRWVAQLRENVGPPPF